MRAKVWLFIIYVLQAYMGNIFHSSLYLSKQPNGENKKDSIHLLQVKYLYLADGCYPQLCQSFIEIPYRFSAQSPSRLLQVIAFTGSHVVPDVLDFTLPLEDSPRVCLQSYLGGCDRNYIMSDMILNNSRIICSCFIKTIASLKYVKLLILFRICIYFCSLLIYQR